MSDTKQTPPGLLVHAAQCDQCLFSKGKIVSDARRREILQDCAAKDKHFICHKGSLIGQELVCRGFFDRFTSQLIRIAGRMNFIKFVKWEDLPILSVGNDDDTDDMDGDAAIQRLMLDTE